MIFQNENDTCDFFHRIINDYDFNQKSFFRVICVPNDRGLLIYEFHLTSLLLFLFLKNDGSFFERKANLPRSDLPGADTVICVTPMNVNDE